MPTDRQGDQASSAEVISVSVRTVKEPTDSVPGQLQVTHGDKQFSVGWRSGLLSALTSITDPNRYAEGNISGSGSHDASSDSRVATATYDFNRHEDLKINPSQAQLQMPGEMDELSRMLGTEARNALIAARQEDRAVQVEIIASPTDPAMQIPWEYMAAGGKAVVLGRGCGVRRRVELAAERDAVQQTRPSSLKGSVLALHRKTDPTFNAVIETLEALHGPNSIASELEAMTPAEVFYVLGHGSEPDPVRCAAARVGGELEAEVLADRFEAIGWPELIVLIVCRSARTVASMPSFAGALCDAGAPAVVGMAGDIETTGIAPSFVSALWDQLSHGASLRDAVCAGRVAIANHGTLQQYGIPVLFTTVNDPLPALVPATVDIPGRADLEAAVEAFIELGDRNFVGGSVIGVAGSRPASGQITSVIRTGSDTTIAGDVKGVDLRR